MDVPALSREQVRELDRRAIQEYGIPGVVLMENAGSAAARWLIELGIHGPVVVCCGKGNNGGDGYVIARHLDAAGLAVHVLLACDPADLSGDPLIHFRILQNSGVPVVRWVPGQDHSPAARRIDDADWLVDALLGTGIRGLVRDPLRAAIEWINAAQARKLAIDIPSGLDCNTGEPCGVAVRAGFTATFAATKLGFLQPVASQYTGTIRVFDIGICRKLLEHYSVQSKIT